jgi:hypothetical protein
VGAQEPVEPALPAVAAAEDPELAFEESLSALHQARRAFQAVGAGGDAARLAWLPRMGRLAEQGSIGAAAWLLRNDPERPAEQKLELYVRLQGTDRAPEMLPSLRRDAAILGRLQALSLAAEIGASAVDDEVRAQALLTQAQIQEDARFVEPARKRIAEGLHRDVVRLYPGTLAAAEAEDALWRLERLEIGRLAPAFRGHDVDGNEIRVSEMTGRVVVLEFWSFDDPGVADRIARRCALNAALREERFALVGVCLDADELAFRRALEEFEVCWPTAFEGMGRVWRIRNGPRTFVLDQGRVIRHVDLDGAELEEAVGRLLQERKEAPKPSPSRAGEQNQ